MTVEHRSRVVLNLNPSVCAALELEAKARRSTTKSVLLSWIAERAGGVSYMELPCAHCPTLVRCVVTGDRDKWIEAWSDGTLVVSCGECGMGDAA